MGEIRINNQTAPRREEDTAPTPAEVEEAVTNVADSDPALNAEDVLDHGNITPAELDATIDSAARLRLPERDVLMRARSAYVSDGAMRLEPSGDVVEPPRLGDGTTLQVDPPQLASHYGVPRNAHDDVGALVPEEDARDDLRWTLSQLGEVREGRLSPDAFLEEIAAHDVRDFHSQPVLSRVRDLVDSVDVRGLHPGDRWMQDETQRQAIDEAIVVTAAAVAARNGYGDEGVRGQFLAFMEAHPVVAEMAAGQVEMLYAGHPFPGPLYEGPDPAPVQDDAPYLRMSVPERRAAALNLMRRASELDEQAFRFSTRAAFSLLQTVDPMDGRRGFIAREAHLPVAEEALRTVLDRNAFNASEVDPGAGTLINYASRIAEHARRHPRGSPEHTDAVRAMDQFVRVLADYGDQFDSIDEAPGENGDAAYASVVRAVRQHFIASRAQRPVLSLEDVPRALSLFQRIPDRRSGDTLAAGGPAASAVTHRVLMEVPAAMRPAVAESLGDSALAEQPSHVDAAQSIRTFAPGVSDAEIAVVRDRSGMNDGEIAALLENAALYNALPEPERARLFERAGVELSGRLPQVDATTLLAAAAQGQLDGSPLAQLIDPRADAPPLRERVLALRDDLLRDEFYALTDLEAAIEEYEGDLERLVSDIESGMDLRLSPIGGNILASVVMARLEQRRGQTTAVNALSASEHARLIAEATLAEVEHRTRRVEAALDVQSISELRRAGTRPQADAADFLSARLQVDTPVRSLAPHLAEEREGPFTGAVAPALAESPLQRIEGETQEQFETRLAEQRARVLSGLIGAESDLEVDAWRTSLDSVDPDFRRVWRDLQALDDLAFFSTVQRADGARFSALADYMEERSAPLQEIFAAPLPQERVEALESSFESALRRPELSERQRQVLNERLNLVRQYDALIHDPRSGAAHLVDPDNFESSFENWVVEEGPAMAGGIAVGVAAGLAASSVVGSGAAPGLALASARLIGTAAAISAGYHVGYNATDLALGTGADAAIWGPALRGEISAGEAGAAAAREIVTGTLFGAAAMGTTSVVLRNFERASTSVLSRWGAGDVNRLRSMMETARQSNAPVNGALWNRFVTEVGEEGGQELAQVAVQSAAQAALAANPDNAALTFGITVMTEAAFGARRSWRAANGAALQNLGLTEGYQGRVFEVQGEAADLPAIADQLRGAGAQVEIVSPNVLMFSDPNGNTPSFLTTTASIEGDFAADTPMLPSVVAANDLAALPPLRAAATVGGVESFDSLAGAISERSRVAAQELMAAVQAGDVGLADVTRVLDAQGTRYQVVDGQVVIDPLRRSFGGSNLNHLAARVSGRYEGTQLVVDPDMLAEGELAGFTDIESRELGLSLRGLLTGRQTFVETHETHAHLRDVYRHGGALDVRVSSIDGRPLTDQFETGPHAREFSFQDLLGAAHTARTLAVDPARAARAEQPVSLEHTEQLGEAVDAGLAVATQTRELAVSAVEALRSGAPLTIVEGNASHAVSFDTDDGRRFNLRVDVEGLPMGPAREPAIRARLTERLAQVEERAHALRGDFVRMGRAAEAGDWQAVQDLAESSHRYASRQSAWVGDVPASALAVDAAGWARVRVGPRAGGDTVDVGTDPYSLAASPVSFSSVLRRAEEIGALAARDADPQRLLRVAGDASDRARLVSAHAGSALDSVNAGNFELADGIATIPFSNRAYGERTMSVDLNGTGVGDRASAREELQRRLRMMTVTADGVRSRAEALASDLRSDDPPPREEIVARATELQRVANADFGARTEDWGPETVLGTESDIRVTAFPAAVRFAESELEPSVVEAGLAGLGLTSRMTEPGYVFDPLTGHAVLSSEVPDRAGYEREVTALRWVSSAPPERVASMIRDVRASDAAHWDSFVGHIAALRPHDVGSLEGEFAPDVSRRDAAAFTILAGHYARRAGNPAGLESGPFAELAPLLENGGNPFPGFPDAIGPVLRRNLGEGEVVAAMARNTPERYRHNGTPLIVSASSPELYDLARTSSPDWQRARRIEGKVEDSPYWPLFERAHRSTMLETSEGEIYPYDAAIVTTGGRDLQHPSFSGESPIHGWFCLGAAEQAVQYLEENGGTYAFVVGATTEVSENQDRGWVAHALAIAPVIERRAGPDGVERAHLALVYMDPQLFFTEPVVIRPGEPFEPNRQLEAFDRRGRELEPIAQILHRDPPLTGESVWTQLEVVTDPNDPNSLVDENGALRVDDQGNPIFTGELRVEGQAYVMASPPESFRLRRFTWDARRLENGDTVFASLNTASMQNRFVKSIGPDGIPRLELTVNPNDGRLNVAGIELARDPALLADLGRLTNSEVDPNQGLSLFLTEDGVPNGASRLVLNRLAPYFGFDGRPDEFSSYLQSFVGSDSGRSRDYPRENRPDSRYIGTIRIPGAARQP